MGQQQAFDPILDMIAERVAAKIEQRISARLQSGTDQRLLTVAQAAKYLGRTKAGIQHMIAAGLLPVVRSDRRVFLDVRELDKWIEQNKQAETAL